VLALLSLSQCYGSHRDLHSFPTRRSSDLGSCAQVGKDVHLSGGVGLGGVLEPATANPVIIEDGAFIGSRCIVVEGVRVGREAVRSEEHTSELQSRENLVCRLLLEKKKHTP